MGITSGLVLFAVIWFMTFFIALPIRVQTQGDLKDVVPGTHAGAPEHHHLRKKALWTTFAAVILWCIIAGIILSEVISVNDIEGWLHPAAVNGTDG
jgi:predicted secreted protein